MRLDLVAKVAWLALLVAAVALMLYGAELERREVEAGVWSEGTGGR